MRIMNHRTHITAGTENGASPNQSKSNILPGPIFGGQVRVASPWLPTTVASERCCPLSAMNWIAPSPPILLNVSIGHCPSPLCGGSPGSPLRAQRDAAALLRMHTRYAESREWQVDVINGSQAATGGFKEIIFEVKG